MVAEVYGPGGAVEATGAGGAPLATDATAQALLTAAEAVRVAAAALADSDAMRREFQPPRVFSVPRDAADRLLVTVGSSSSIVANTLNLWNAGVYSGPYGANASINNIDARELLAAQQLAAFQQRRARWVLT